MLVVDGVSAGAGAGAGEGAGGEALRRGVGDGVAAAGAAADSAAAGPLRRSAGARLTVTFFAGGPTWGAIRPPTVILSASGFAVFSIAPLDCGGTVKVCPA